MSILVANPLQAMATTVQCDAHMLHVFLQDGRQISVPLEWFPRLRNASEKQRKRWKLIGQGIGIRWLEVDEDISVAALLGGSDFGAGDSKAR